MTTTDRLGDENQQQPTLSWKNILRPLLIALAVWSLLAVFLSALEYLSHRGPLEQEVMLRRIADLFIPSLLFFAGPLLLFLVTFGLVRGQWRKALALGLKTGCGAFALVAIVWAGIAGWAFVNDEDHWDAIPWVTRPTWKNFIGAILVSKLSAPVDRDSSRCATARVEARMSTAISFSARLCASIPVKLRSAMSPSAESRPTPLLNANPP